MNTVAANSWKYFKIIKSLNFVTLPNLPYGSLCKIRYLQDIDIWDFRFIIPKDATRYKYSLPQTYYDYLLIKTNAIEEIGYKKFHQLRKWNLLSK